MASAKRTKKLTYAHVMQRNISKLKGVEECALLFTGTHCRPHTVTESKIFRKG